MRYVAVVPVVLLAVAGCATKAPPPHVAVAASAAEEYVPPPAPPVVSVYVEPPLSQPKPIAVGWAPPPMLVESPAAAPFPEAVWVGGYWVWEGNWVWAKGHWVGPPRPKYAWVHPYYEARDGVVIFVAGHWAPPGVAFVPPPPGLHLTVEVPLAGVVAGPRPIGPNGCFVPPPPGSKPGFIVPAPLGTAPAVVTGAPPVLAVGMRITAGVDAKVTIEAPAGVIAGGKAFSSEVPAKASLAAAQTPVVKSFAPEPVSRKAIPSYTAGAKPVLPAAQAVSATIPPPRALAHHEHKPAKPGPLTAKNMGTEHRKKAAAADKVAVADKATAEKHLADSAKKPDALAKANTGDKAKKAVAKAHNPPNGKPGDEANKAEAVAKANSGAKANGLKAAGAANKAKESSSQSATTTAHNAAHGSASSAASKNAAGAVAHNSKSATKKPTQLAANTKAPSKSDDKKSADEQKKDTPAIVAAK